MFRNRFFRMATTASVLCVFVSTLTARADDRTPKKKKNINLSYVNSQTFFAVYLQPKQILAHKRAAPEVVGRSLNTLKEMTGIDVGDLNQVIIQSVPAKKGDFDEDDIVLVLRCEKPGDGKTIREKLKATTEVEFGGKKYFQSTNEHRPSIYFANDRTFVVGMPHQLEEILSEDDGSSPVIRRLMKVDAACDAALVVNVKLWAPFVKFIPGDKPLPPDKLFLREFLAHVEAVTIQAKLDHDVPVTAVMEAKDASGEKVEATAKDLLAHFQTSYKENREQILERAEQVPLAKVAVNVFDKAIAGTKIKRNGDRVLVSVEAKGGLPDAMDVMLSWFVIGVGGSAQDSSDSRPSSSRGEQSAPTDRPVP